MELEGLKRGMTFLERHVKVKDLVTDRHSMVKHTYVYIMYENYFELYIKEVN
jgi:hypothetical protein